MTKQALKVGLPGYDLQSLSDTMWDTGNKRFGLTNEAPVNQAVVFTLQRPAKTVHTYSSLSLSTQRKTRSWRSCKRLRETWDLKHAMTKAQVKSGMELMAKGDFSGMYARSGPMYVELDGLNANFANDESLA